MAVPPGGLQEICFSFDTTGSMSSCLTEVRGRVQDMIQRLQADIPGIRIAVFAHGDYCDRGKSYVTKHVDFSTNVAELCDFVQSVGSTGGGDSDECYELVLHEVQSLKWTPGSQRALVMIGDANPHEPNYGMNKKKLDWRNETEKLANMSVRIYGVECHGYSDTKDFYNTIAQKTGGHRLKLSEFSNMLDFIMSICYREQGAEFLQMYEKEVRERDAMKGVHKDMDRLFGALRDTDSSPMDTSFSVPTPLTKIPSLTKTPSITSLKKRCVKPSSTKRKRLLGSQKKRLTSEAMKVRLSKDSKLPKLRRENVPESNFMLNSMKWSPWKVVISSDDRSSDEDWVKRKGMKKGFRVKKLFGGENAKSALYEFSVQTGFGKRRHTVYSKLSRGLHSNESWESRLLSKKDIQSQIDDVINKGCSVSVRRVIINKRNLRQTRDIMSSRRRYDYAWSRQIRCDKATHRSVMKSSVNISSDEF